MEEPDRLVKPLARILQNIIAEVKAAFVKRRSLKQGLKINLFLGG